MATLSTVIKRDLSAMGKFLFVGAIMLLVAEHREHLPAVERADASRSSVLAIGIFSAFMLYDLKRVRDGGETNYITATLRDLPGPVQRVPDAAARSSASPAADRD